MGVTAGFFGLADTIVTSIAAPAVSRLLPHSSTACTEMGCRERNGKNGLVGKWTDKRLRQRSEMTMSS